MRLCGALGISSRFLRQIRPTLDVDGSEKLAVHRLIWKRCPTFFSFAMGL